MNGQDSELVEKALHFWVAARFIETWWHLTGTETLGMAPDPNPASPYHDHPPDTPIMDFQIDNVVINSQLKPLWVDIRRLLLPKMLSKDRKDWFEVQLAQFILLNHVDWTMSHDIDFARRYSMSVRDIFSKLVRLY